MGCLYKLTSPSGKSYIGITIKTAELRFVAGAKKRIDNPEWHRKQTESKSKEFYIIDPNLNTYRIKNLKDFCKHHKLTRSCDKISGRRGSGKWHTIPLPVKEVDILI